MSTDPTKTPRRSDLGETEFRPVEDPSATAYYSGETSGLRAIDSGFVPKEKLLADVLWESVEMRFSGPGPQQLSTKQNKYEKSLFTPAPSRLVYRPAGKWKTFESKIALIAPFTPPWDGAHYYLNMEGEVSRTARFIVKGDGKELYRSEIDRDANEKFVSVDIANVDVLGIDHRRLLRRRKI